MDKITPFLWLEKDAELAAKFYVSIFKGSKIVGRNGMSTTVDLRGSRIILFNGGPHFKQTPAASLFVDCKSQKEVDTYWTKLLEGGQPSRCGWLVDKFGVSWQIVPTVLGKLLNDEDRSKAQRVMNVMLKMVKLDVAELEAAAIGPAAPKKSSSPKKRPK